RLLQETNERMVLHRPPYPAAPSLHDRLGLRERTADEEERSHDDVGVPCLDGGRRVGADGDAAVAVACPLDRERVLDPGDPARYSHSGLQLSSGSGACRVAMS